MKLIGEDVPIDLAFLPIGEHFVMGPKDAAKAAELLHPKNVVSIHYGTFPPLVGDPKEFAQFSCRQRGEGIDAAARRESGGVKELSGWSARFHGGS
jgi:L-ascorbate metabolism protein UlaG (beta-lactamase superfamily)